MKRIIRSNALETSVTTVNANNLSESLQTMLNQPPSSVAHLLLLSSILFLAMALTWVWSARIEEIGQIPGKLVPIDSENVQEASSNIAEIAETQLKQNDSQFVLKFDVQNQHLTEIQTKLNQIHALMVNTYLTDSTNTHKPIKQTKSALRFTTTAADNTSVTKLDTANIFSNISHNLFPKTTKNSLIQLELQQEIQQLRKDISQLQIQLTKTHNRLSKIQTKIKQSLQNNSVNKHREKPTKNQALVLVTALPERITNFIDSGDKVQILLDAKLQQNPEIIFGKVISIVTDRETNENCKLNLNVNKNNLPQIVSKQKQASKCKMMISSKKTPPAKVKLVRNYLMTDIFFDFNQN
ncbi:hypothetical protein [Brunnivagina elsteri]|uniref:HlyD family secretion protein n=1 Tax=Brunnivagina elsteri CCALA 953 TaxID=987040 RepID=A0A2A2TDV7_9CYAN|nr:hypothetical protein [Calothrix elsteri]PAX51987.1 hypothetical protein CK510_21790 [Calothrix elsteri CCALA 953]